MVPELLAQTHDVCGENPLWDERRQLLFWCDIPHGEIYAYDPNRQGHHLVHRGEECGAFTLQEDGHLLLLHGGAMATLHPESGQLSPAQPGLSADTGRFNDCIADPEGRVFAGSSDFAQQNKRGGIHLIETNGKATELWRGTNCANGWGFSPDGSTLYFSDTTAAHVLAYSFVPGMKALGEPRTLLDLPGKMPDGMTVDREGNLWVAFWDGACLRQYSSQGVLLREVNLPARHVTSCAFGGPNYQDLYVTTAGWDAKSAPDSGGLYRLRPPVGGRPEWRSRIQLG